MGLFNGTRSVGWTGFGVLLVALSATACGGGDDKPSGGGSADFGALQKKYASPSGTLSASDKAAIVAGLDKQSDAAASGISAPAGAHVGIGGAKGAHVLDTEPFTCGTPAQGATSVNCTCTGGGTVAISGSESSDGSSLQSSESFNNCKFDEAGSSAVINGSLSYAEITSPPPEMTIIKENFTETITPPGDTIKVDLDYAEIAGMISYSVDVADGNVLLSATGNWDSTTDSGSFTVTTKDGTYSCSLTNGAGTCTGSSGSVTFS